MLMWHDTGKVQASTSGVLLLPCQEGLINVIDAIDQMPSGRSQLAPCGGSPLGASQSLILYSQYFVGKAILSAKE